MNKATKRLAYFFWGVAFAIMKVFHVVGKKIRREYYISRLCIHKSARLGTAYLDTANISIGRGTYIKSGEILSGAANVTIGEFCAIGRNVSIKARTHNVTKPVKLTETGRNQRVEKDIVIGDRVWIGDNVFIREGVTIGDNAIIGANSVVTHSVPRNTVVAGVPAVVIRMLP